MNKIVSVNPYDGSVIGEVAASTEDQIRQAVQSAHQVKAEWLNLGVQERVSIMTEVYESLLSRKDEIAELDSREMGFPITQCHEFNLGDAFAYYKWNL